MGKYKIYRIPDYVYPDGSVGKIGMSKVIDNRMRDNKNTSQSPFDFWEILEEHDCKFTASNREIELQIQYGYKVDKNRYAKMNFSKNGRKGSDKWNMMVNNDPILKKKQSKHMRMMTKLANEANRGRIVSDETRQKISQSNKSSGRFKGENNPDAKLTEDKVRYIRKWCKPGRGNGTYTYQRMADAMDVSKAVIASVVTKRTWRHI